MQSFSKIEISSLELRSNTEQVRKKVSLLQASRKGRKESVKENNLKTVSQSLVEEKVKQLLIPLEGFKCLVLCNY